MLETTCRIIPHNYNPPDSSVIYAVWHGLQNYLGGIPDREKIHILISPSTDGEIIARIVEGIGFSTVRGSTKRQGAKATREIISLLEDGKNVVYAIDGPKGPHGKVKEGIIRIAQMAQRPIVPISGAANLKKVIPSWDKYEIYFPFAKVPVVFAIPYTFRKIYRTAKLKHTGYRLKMPFSTSEMKLSKGFKSSSLSVKRAFPPVIPVYVRLFELIPSPLSLPALLHLEQTVLPAERTYTHSFSRTTRYFSLLFQSYQNFFLKITV